MGGRLEAWAAIMPDDEILIYSSESDARETAEGYGDNVVRLVQAEEDTDDIPTIAYMCGSADQKDHIRKAVEWFLECWETPPPKHGVAYDECEATLLQALADVAKSVGITRSVKHWMDLVSEETEKSENMNETDK